MKSLLEKSLSSKKHFKLFFACMCQIKEEQKIKSLEILLVRFNVMRLSLHKFHSLEDFSGLVIENVFTWILLKESNFSCLP